MKTIMIVAAMTLVLSGFSQDLIQPGNTFKVTDMNNAPLKKPSIIANAHYANPADMSGYLYDSIRELTEINQPIYADAYPWISSDGLRLYYTSGLYEDRLVVAEREDVNSYFGTPQELPYLMYRAFSYWLSTDELDVYFCYSDYPNDFYLYYAHRDSISLPFSEPVQINLNGEYLNFISGPSLNNAQDELYLYSFSLQIVRFLRTSSDSFEYAGTLSAPEGFDLLPGQLSKDDLAIFFGAKNYQGLIKLYQMTRATPADIFDIASFQEIQGINDDSVANIQPSMSDSLEWLAFVRNHDGFWEGNDLFLAHKGIITSVFNPAETYIFSSTFPNPASAFVCIKYKSSTQGPIVASVYSYEGKLMFEDMCESFEGITKINTGNWNNGLYCYSLTQAPNKKNGAVTGKFIVMH